MTAQVYFVECAGQIKIGFSKNAPERLRKLSQGNVMPLTPIGIMDGSKRLERAIHVRLADYRGNGEWFGDCEEVRSVIADLLKTGPSTIGFVESRAVESQAIVAPEYAHHQAYRFRKTRHCVAMICIRIGHIWGDLAEAFAPWLRQGMTL